MRKICFFLLVITYSLSLSAQELYNLTQPASTLPKGALGIRLFDESYSESGLIRKITVLKVMYGLTPKLSFVLSGVASDYHSLNLPLDFIKHDHVGGAPPSPNTPAPVPNPYIFNGADLYGQYRFFSSDGQNSHFRMAAYGEASKTRIASHLAEAELLTHNSGFGAGVITTYLKSHFAATATLGYIIPLAYQGNAYDIYGGAYATKIIYGNAANFDLALGYLLFPQHYKNYKQPNLNIYLEFLGKSYGAATVTQQDGIVTDHISNTIPILRAGNYVDVNPGVQYIIRSSTRIDVSVGFPLINSSYIHAYPLYYIGIQRYFFFRKHSVAKND